MTLHINPLIESLGWKTAEELIKYETQIMVFKSVNVLAPKYLSDVFNANSKNSSYILGVLLRNLGAQENVLKWTKQFLP